MDNKNDTWGREPEDPAEMSGRPAASPRTAAARRAVGGDKARIAGALIVGGLAGGAILGPISTLAASADPSATAAASLATDPSASADPSATTTPTVTTAPVATTAPATTAPTGTTAPSTGTAAPAAGDQDQDGHGPGGGRNEAVTDTSVVAKAIGISEADLTTALQGGQTVAQVAAAHNVNLQVVIDALVADGQAELDAAVKAGTMTQAQADAEKANLTQRATDQANGSFEG
ncbi:MAG TPA: hypothetical protein VHS36_06855, partial [Candidatus Limnocylindrales bacterium]|nr:hypothetical protein [Candidatus Limnocylindrales bacterium]